MQQQLQNIKWGCNVSATARSAQVGGDKLFTSLRQMQCTVVSLLLSPEPHSHPDPGSSARLSPCLSPCLLSIGCQKVGESELVSGSPSSPTNSLPPKALCPMFSSFLLLMAACRPVIVRTNWIHTHIHAHTPSDSFTVVLLIFLFYQRCTMSQMY